MAKLEEMGKDVVIITQNIDGLHQKAGSKNVIEMHGTDRTWSCKNKKCGNRVDSSEVKELRDTTLSCLWQIT